MSTTLLRCSADAAAGLTFVWIGRILGIGRVAFRALNRVELALATLITAGAAIVGSDHLAPLALITSTTSASSS